MNVEHDTENHKFVVRLPEGKGEMVYEKTSPTVLDIQHTAVDGTLRGRGVAEALAETAVAYARANGFSIVPTCTYLQRWLSKHPEQQDLIVIRQT